MSHQRMMQRLARWHIWLGWLVGFPILMWTITGLVMVVRPIEAVRGEHLLAPPPPIVAEGIVFPRIDDAIAGASLVQQRGGPVWLITAADGRRWRYSAVAGTAVPPVLKDEAQTIAQAAYAGQGALQSVTYFPADAAPLELRRNVASWQARFADGTNLYVDDTTGEVLAVRTRGWRVYDLMWGLHIMDLETREDTHHPLLIGFAAISVAGALIGCILLFRRRKARPRGGLQSRPQPGADAPA
ncbi:MAG: hypothetical protein B7Z33_03155 [Sphingomonadales bacterium 12-68-11]|nr:MAG: hypothetical protein B7Z33_03155 [Sphingomonadales bacterium 12-68-11]OYX16855.1 MAG: hypothetical protein B7Z07_01740 [Sphingomonadales bacterium 32-67-7]